MVTSTRAHKYAPDDRSLVFWGQPGTRLGKFNLVHNTCSDDEGWVYVADREDYRVQVFDLCGRFEAHWASLSQPYGLCMPMGKDPLRCIGELGPGNVARTMRHAPNLGTRVTIKNRRSELLAFLGSKLLGEGLDQVIAPHGIAVDPRGDICAAKVSNTYWDLLFGEKPDHGLRCMRKLVRLADAQG